MYFYRTLRINVRISNHNKSKGFVIYRVSKKYINSVKMKTNKYRRNLSATSMRDQRGAIQRNEQTISAVLPIKESVSSLGLPKAANQVMENETADSEGDVEVVNIDVDPKNFGPGMWFFAMSLAIRSRTPDTIDHFIGYAVPVMMNLLCSTCTKHARENIKKCHPSTYKNKHNHRGENIGMMLWVYDFHNIVNPIADPPKPIFPFHHMTAIYAPLIALSDNDIAEDSMYAQSPLTTDNVTYISFIDDDVVADIDAVTEVIDNEIVNQESALDSDDDTHNGGVVSPIHSSSSGDSKLRSVVDRSIASRARAGHYHQKTTLANNRIAANTTTTLSANNTNRRCTSCQ